MHILVKSSDSTEVMLAVMYNVCMEFYVALGYFSYDTLTIGNEYLCLQICISGLIRRNWASYFQQMFLLPNSLTKRKSFK